MVLCECLWQATNRLPTADLILVSLLCANYASVRSVMAELTYLLACGRPTVRWTWLILRLMHMLARVCVVVLTVGLALALPYLTDLR